MKATVIKAFSGRPDTAPLPRMIAVGEEIDGAVNAEWERHGSEGSINGVIEELKADHELAKKLADYVNELVAAPQVQGLTVDALGRVKWEILEAVLKLDDERQTAAQAIWNSAKQAFQADRRGALVGRVLAERFGWKLGDRISFVGDIFPGTLELFVRGIYDSELGAESLYFNWEVVREGLSPARKDMISSVSILAESPAAVPRIIETVDDMFRNATVQTRTETERAFALGFVNSLGNIKLILLSVCGAVTFTIMLVAANTMAMSIRERTREIGILKTLGFRPGLILFLILGEAVMLACMGGGVGHLFVTGLVVMIRENAPAVSSQIRTLTVPWPVIGVMFGTSILIALASSVLPAYSASRINILEALRRTD